MLLIKITPNNNPSSTVDEETQNERIKIEPNPNDSSPFLMDLLLSKVYSPYPHKTLVKGGTIHSTGISSVSNNISKAKPEKKIKIFLIGTEARSSES